MRMFVPTRNILLCLLCLGVPAKILKPIAKQETVERVARAINSFGLELYREVIQNDKNAVYSPFGISLLLSALLVGARGKTATEINQTLHYNDFSLEDIATTFHDIFVNENLVGYELHMYKAMFFQHGIRVDNNFGDIVGKLFLVEGKSTNFTDPSVTDKLNDYVKKGSFGKITKLFDAPIDPNIKFLLVNAMYFNGVWHTKFDRNNTKLAPFYNGGSSESKSVPMMNLNSEFFYVDDDSLQSSLLKIPYADNEGHMIIILPRSKKGLKSVERLLTIDLLQKAIESMVAVKVNVTIPRFNVSNSFKLQPPLGKLGMKRAFISSKADFFGVVGIDGISLSEILQKMAIEVTEEGTKAASEGAIIPRSGEGAKTTSFKADHPFMYLIQDKATNLFFFMGHVISL